MQFLDRGQQRLRAEGGELIEDPLIEGTRQSNPMIPSQTMAGNAMSPRATGGQITPASAIGIGPRAVRPTMRSNGPPGR